MCYIHLHFHFIIIIIISTLVFNLAGSPRPLKVDTRAVFETDSVSVALEWRPEEGVSYSISVDQVDFRYIQRTTVNLTVLYNIPTNVTITATSCGQNGETSITSIELAYGSFD